VTPPIRVFDGHNDTLLRLGGDPDAFFRRNDSGHIDLPRAREGSLAGGFCAIFTRFSRQGRQPGDGEPAPTPDLAFAQNTTLAMMGRLFRLAGRSHGDVRIVTTAAEIEAAIAAGSFAALMHVEGAESIDPDLDALEVFYRAGLRSLGVVWSRANIFGEGVPFRFNTLPDTGPGLTDRGLELVRACNRLGILIDLSHLNERGFWDVARVSEKPLVATHSNAWALSPATRNLTDKQLDAVRESDGMVGINFAVGFLRADGAHEPDTPLETVVRHVDYLARRIGIDHVGFGSDFDGATIPQALGDASGLPRLLDALRRHGYDESSLHKIAHENWVRVLRLTWGA
jgi:membrane dipeptidase